MTGNKVGENIIQFIYCEIKPLYKKYEGKLKKAILRTGWKPKKRLKSKTKPPRKEEKEKEEGKKLEGEKESSQTN